MPNIKMHEHYLEYLQAKELKYSKELLEIRKEIVKTISIIQAHCDHEFERDSSHIKVCYKCGLETGN